MNKRTFNIAMANAEVRALIRIKQFSEEFEQNGNQNKRGRSPEVRQGNNAEGNVPAQPAQVQQPVYGG